MSARDTSICVLVDAPITNDARVQRTTRTLSRLGRVLLVTSGGSDLDQRFFDDRVEVKPTVRARLSGLRKWFLLHRHNDQLAEAALAGGRSFDLVWANDYSTLFPAVRIARATGAKVVYDSHEIWLETINQFFPRDVSLHRRLAFRAIVGICRAIGKFEEPRLAAQADAIVTVNESLADVLGRHLRRRQVGVVLNCPEPVELRPSDRIQAHLGISAVDPIVLYQGVMNPGRGLHALVAAADDLPDGVRLVLLGGGMLEESLARAVDGAGLQDRVFLAGTVPQAELHEWTASADLGVLVLEPINLSKRLALANKIFEYMAAGIPILTTDLPENRRIVDHCECGWLISDWTPLALAREITRILDEPEEMRRRGANGRRWFEERYNWDVEGGHVLATVERLVPHAGVVEQRPGA
jgi:glycosyltransferase involved in cell wall biosynthesis